MQKNIHRLLLILMVALLGAILYFVFGARPAIAPIDESPTATTSATSSASNKEESTAPQSPIIGTKEDTTNVRKSASPAPHTVSSVGRLAPELVRPTGYSNIDNIGMLSTDQFTLERWRGQKVILLEFFTPSSLASEHTIPYLNYWQNVYRNDGLLVIGVHTPQFTFERSKAVIDQFISVHQIQFPVVLDTEYATWNAYKNSVWPHLYLIDTTGRIVYDHAGDGAYEATQAKMTELLSRNASKLGKSFTVGKFVTPKNASVTDLSKVGSMEAYLGSARNTALSNGVPLKSGPQSFEEEGSVALNKISLSGNWNFNKEYAETMTENTSLSTRYRAKGVYAMLSAEKPVKITVLCDGVPLTLENAGGDIRFEKGASIFYAKDARIYEVIKNTAGYSEHTITLMPDRGGLRIFSISFD